MSGGSASTVTVGLSAVIVAVTEEVPRVRKDLLEYCKRDTWGDGEAAGEDAHAGLIRVWLGRGLDRP